MKAWLTYDFGQMKMVDVPMPALTDKFVLVRIEVCQPSVTDAVRFSGVVTSGSEQVKKILEKEAPYQLFGHEFSGKVVSFGKSVTKFNVDDRVSSRARVFCGECIFCKRNEYESCLSLRRIGVDYPGCFAEYVVLPETTLELVPNGLTANETACLQPLSSAVLAVDTAQVKMGDNIVVLGLGVMGQYISQIARVSGAGAVIGVDVKEKNIALSKKLGIDYTINSTNEDVIEGVSHLTQKKGANIVFECAGGNPEEGLAGYTTLGQAFEIVGKGGTVMQIAHPLPGKTVPYELRTLRKKAIKHIGPPVATSSHFLHGANLILMKRINIKDTITHILQGIDKVPEAFDITRNKARYEAMNPAQVVIWEDKA